MKIRCRNCNTRFDYDKQEGYCPKCGSINEKPVKEKKQRKHRGGCNFWVICLILILILGIGWPVSKVLGTQKYESYRDINMQSQTIALEEKMEISNCNLKLTGTEWHGLHEEKQFLQVGYAMCPNNFMDTQYVKDRTRIYLYADGQYYESYEEPYTLRLLLPEEDPYRKVMQGQHYTGTLEDSKGNLAFVTPEGVQEVYLLLVIYDDAIYDGVVRQPAAKYRLPVEVTK